MKDNICLENDNWKRSYTIRMHNGGSFEGVFVIDGAIIVWNVEIFPHSKAIGKKMYKMCPKQGPQKVSQKLIVWIVWMFLH